LYLRLHGHRADQPGGESARVGRTLDLVTEEVRPGPDRNRILGPSRAASSEEPQGLLDRPSADPARAAVEIDGGPSTPSRSMRRVQRRPQVAAGKGGARSGPRWSGKRPWSRSHALRAPRLRPGGQPAADDLLGAGRRRRQFGGAIKRSARAEDGNGRAGRKESGFAGLRWPNVQRCRAPSAGHRAGR